MSTLRAICPLTAFFVVVSLAMGQPPAAAGPKQATDADPAEAPRLKLGSSTLATGEMVVGGTLSPDGKYLALAGRDSITLFNRQSGKRLSQISGSGFPPQL